MLEHCTPWPEAICSTTICRRVYWQPQSLADLLEARARAMPDRTFVSDAHGTLSYARGRPARRPRGAASRSISVCSRATSFCCNCPTSVNSSSSSSRCRRSASFRSCACRRIAAGELTSFRASHRRQGLLLSAALPQLRLRAHGQRDPGGGAERCGTCGDGRRDRTAASPISRPGSTRNRRRATSRACSRRYRPDPFEVAFFLLVGRNDRGTEADPAHPCRLPVQRPGMRARARLGCRHRVHGRASGRPQFSARGAGDGGGARWPAAASRMCASTDAETVFDDGRTAEGDVSRGQSGAADRAAELSAARHKYDLGSLRHVYAGGQKMLPELVDRTRATWSFVMRRPCLRHGGGPDQSDASGRSLGDHPRDARKAGIGGRRDQDRRRATARRCRRARSAS